MSPWPGRPRPWFPTRPDLRRAAKMADVLDDAEVARVLSITAHPDDVDFGAAGTMARWTEAGIEVIYCVVTDGDAGGFDESFPRDEMPTLRRAEQVAAAKCVGVHDVRFLGYPDGRVQATLDLRRDLARVIRQVRPDRVVCPSPERNYDRIGIGHRDHRAGCAAALDAVYPDARAARLPPRPRAPPARRRAAGMRTPCPPGPCARAGSRAGRRTTTWT